MIELSNSQQLENSENMTKLKKLYEDDIKWFNILNNNILFNLKIHIYL